ncbi:MAG: TIGR02466 family protein [Kiloniellales bacterium]|nr:TIGR02466 family protein [Kiloniellales bacterium]
MSETDAGPKIQVNGIFATPVAILMLPDAAALNEALKTTILAREQSHPSTRHSNLGGWQSSWDFAEWGGPAGQQVLGAARHVANQLTSDRQGQKRKIDWKINAWANINRDGHGNEFHTHPGAFWSGSYYVDDGGVGADPSLGGQFEIQDPRGVAPAMYAPGLAFAIPGGQSCGASEVVSPRSGMILMFPSWLSHAVRPYTGGGTRISVAFNLSI